MWINKLFFILLIILYTSNINAESISNNNKEPNYLLNFSLLTAGIITQYPITHELGHYFTAKILNKNIKFNNDLSWNVEDLTKEEKKYISSSGFIFPLLISEIILDTNIPKDNPYVIGLIIGPLINNSVYILKDTFDNNHRKNNDLEKMNNLGFRREYTYPLILILPSIQIYRLIKNKEVKKKWNFWFSTSKSGNEINGIISFNF